MPKVKSAGTFFRQVCFFGTIQEINQLRIICVYLRIGTTVNQSVDKMHCVYPNLPMPLLVKR